MTKFKQTYQQMVDEHLDLFKKFKSIHDNYLADRKTYSSQFHQVGAQVLEIIRDYEQRLCASMERGHFSQYSHRVADRFWAEVKKDYSHIELVGVKSNFD